MVHEFDSTAELMALMLNGKQPAKVPYEPTTAFDLPAAKASGVSIPQGIMLRANRLIE